MITLVLNNQTERAVPITAYNRNTTFEEGALNSVAYFTVTSNTETASLLNELGISGITSIEIFNDEDLIYSLTELTAHITTINEYLEGEHIVMSVNIAF